MKKTSLWAGLIAVLVLLGVWASGNGPGQQAMPELPPAMPAPRVELPPPPQAVLPPPATPAPEKAPVQVTPAPATLLPPVDVEPEQAAPPAVRNKTSDTLRTQEGSESRLAWM